MTETKITQRQNRLSALAIFVFWAGFMFWAPLSGDAPFSEAALPVVDGYMRLIWVEQLYAGGGWYNHIIPDISAPFGGSLHWTRPLDILIIIGAQPLEMFMEPNQAIFWSGAFLCPLLLLACLYALAWAIKPLVGAGSWFPATVIFLFQVSVFSYAGLGRTDHHTLLLLFEVLLLGAIIHSIIGQAGTRSAVLAGLFGAAGLWVSPEMALALIPCVLILTWLWVTDPARWQRQIRIFALVLLGATALVVAVEHPPSAWFDTVYDKVSFPYILLLACFAGFWLFCDFSPKLMELKNRRMVLLGLWGGTSLALITWYSPGILFGSLSQVDPKVADLWMNQVGEMRSLMPLDLWQFGMLISVLGLGFIALPVILHRVMTTENGPLKDVFLFFVFGTVITFILAIQHARFGAIAELFFVLSLAVPLRDWLAKLKRQKARPLAAMEGFVLVTVLAVGCIMVGAPIARSQTEARDQAKPFAMDGTCDIKPLAKFLDTDPQWPRDQKLIIGAHVNMGTRLVYHSRHRVVGTPYHRNGDAIYDTVTLMHTSDDSVAKNIVRSRQMDMIVVCEPRLVSGTTGAAPVDAAPFFAKLALGDMPVWLHPLSWPETSDIGLRVFLVDKEALMKESSAQQ